MCGGKPQLLQPGRESLGSSSPLNTLKPNGGCRMEIGRRGRADAVSLQQSPIFSISAQSSGRENQSRRRENASRDRENPSRHRENASRRRAKRARGRESAAWEFAKTARSGANATRGAAKAAGGDAKPARRVAKAARDCERRPEFIANAAHHLAIALSQLLTAILYYSMWSRQSAEKSHQEAETRP